MSAGRAVGTRDVKPAGEALHHGGVGQCYEPRRAGEDVVERGCDLFAARA